MQKSTLHRRRIALVLLLVMAGLLAGVLLSRYSAIQTAIQACDSFHLRAEGQPSAVKTQIDTYQRDPTEPERIVWKVAMSGKWLLVGGPAPVPGQPEPAPRHFERCTVVVDVFTGSSLEIGAGFASAGE